MLTHDFFLLVLTNPQRFFEQAMTVTMTITATDKIKIAGTTTPPIIATVFGSEVSAIAGGAISVPAQRETL